MTSAKNVPNVKVAVVSAKWGDEMEEEERGG
jgi:hypothetical protein